MAAYGTGYYGRGVYGIGNVVISGNQASGAVGNLLTDRSIQEDGTIATGNVGTVGIAVSVALIGNAATGAAQSLFVSPIITGNSAIGDVGTVSAEVISFQAITGVDGTGAIGSPLGVVSAAITGNTATGAVGIIFGFGWGAIPDNAETYIPISDSAETWTVIADNSETWTPI